MKKLFVSIVFMALPVITFATNNASSMTTDQFKAEFTGFFQRERVAQEDITREETQIILLHKQIAQAENKIVAAIQTTYAFLGITGQDVLDAEVEQAALKSSLERFALMSKDSIIANNIKITQLESRLIALKANKAASLNRIAARIPEIDQIFKQIKAALDLAIPKQNTLVQTRQKKPVVVKKRAFD
jgi:hypothetical protein